MAGAQCDADELAEMAKAGDLAVLDKLTRCYGDRLFAIGRRYCRSEEEAHDAVQDAMVSAGVNIGKFRGDGAVEAWVSRMVANACHKMRRGLKNKDSIHEEPTDMVDLESSPESAAARAQLAGALGQALLVLSPKDRAITLLAEVEGWTGPQIASRMGMTAGAVRVRLSRARVQLRDEMFEYLDV
jgi:RNA polymerase sigma-70 factor (ECF subfamily)